MEIIEQIGEEGITAFVAAFYRRMQGDDMVGPMYPQGC